MCKLICPVPNWGWRLGEKHTTGLRAMTRVVRIVPSGNSSVCSVRSECVVERDRESDGGCAQCTMQVSFRP